MQKYDYQAGSQRDALLMRATSAPPPALNGKKGAEEETVKARRGLVLCAKGSVLPLHEKKTRRPFTRGAVSLPTSLCPSPWAGNSEFDLRWTRSDLPTLHVASLNWHDTKLDAFLPVHIRWQRQVTRGSLPKANPEILCQETRQKLAIRASAMRNHLHQKTLSKGGSLDLARRLVTWRGIYMSVTHAGYPVSSEGVSFDPLLVLGVCVCPAVGGHGPLATEGIRTTLWSARVISMEPIHQGFVALDIWGLRHQNFITRGPKVNCVRQADSGSNGSTPPCGMMAL